MAAPNLPDSEINKTAEEVGKNAKKGGSDLIVVPIPISNPTVETGVTVAGVLFYNPNNAPRPWISGVAALATTNGSKGAAAFHNMSMNDDKYRIIALAGYADLHVNFYGVGPGAGDRNRSIGLSEKGAAAMLQGQFRAANNVYAGVRYQFLDLNTTVRNKNPVFPEHEIPAQEFKSTNSSIGPSMSYDSRNNSTNPTSGELATAVWMFNLEELGGDFVYDKLNLAANLYRTIRPGSVLALHAGLCGVSRGAPFYDLCLYGQGNDLRGYETGRYRDGASWAGQFEFRQHVTGRFGAVVFAGVGGVAPSLGNLEDSRILPSAGAGIRYRPSRETDVNIRLDFAVGRDSNAIYFSIGEAF